MDVYVQRDKHAGSEKCRCKAIKHLQMTEMWATEQAMCRLLVLHWDMKTTHTHTHKSTHSKTHTHTCTIAALYKAAARANVTNQSLTAVSTYTFTAQLRAGGEHMSMQCTHSDTRYEHRGERTHTPDEDEDNYTTVAPVFHLWFRPVLEAVFASLLWKESPWHPSLGSVFSSA